MVLPLFAFVIGTAVFLTLAVIVLRLTGIAPVRPLTLAAFVLAAAAGTLLYATVIRTVITGSDGHLHSTAAVFLFLVGLLIVASISGAGVARFAQRISGSP
jgi:uncharacterized membrane protein YcaP (DUF421 family)